MSKAALIRLATGIAGLIAWGLILFNGLERTCSQMIDRVCVEYGGAWVFSHAEAATWAALLMAGVISAYVLSRGLD